MTKTKTVKINPWAIEQAVIDEAAEVLGRGGLVVFPTDTVYGIAANLLSKSAVERLKQIKDRPQDKQFSIHVASLEDADKYAVNILPRAYKMMAGFWPGPLTVILQAPEAKSVALRMPKNEVALRLLTRVDFPVIAPSANLAGRPPAVDAAGALAELNGLVDLVLDAGPAEYGAESTILDARTLPFSVLREGVLGKVQVQEAAGKKTVLFVCTGNSCRSVMAEYLLNKNLKDSGRFDVDVLSAGTFAFFGMSPTQETQRLVMTIGQDASAHRARRVDLELLRQSDLILTMERRHKEDIITRFPQVRERVFVLGEFLQWGAAADIEDPIGRSEEFYRECFLKIKEAAEKLQAML